MATTASVGSASKKAPQAVKRKQSFSDDDMSDSDSDSPSSPGKIGSGKVSASQQLVPVPGQPDAPLVTKRTLQNRKAQREFRKRREARVRELEERCRRFDQMGLEANSELQRLARRLKDENEALKSLIARLGFAHMIPGIIESINHAEQQQQPPHAQHPHHHHGAPQPPQSFAPMEMGMDAWAHAGHGALSTNNDFTNQRDNAAVANKQSSGNRGQEVASSHTPVPVSSLSSMPGLTDLLPVTASGVNPGLLSENNGKGRNNKQATESSTQAIAVPTNDKSTTTARPIADNSTFDNEWFAQLAQTGHDKDDADIDTPVANENAARNHHSSANPILSLNFNNASDSKNNKSFTNSSNTSALSGSAMLGANARGFGPGLASALGLPASSAPSANIFPMPMPTHQNGALLNPNPIPFAFNLSENKMPGDQSWWSQVAGNALEGDDNILDEKAQAVAQATGAASPFDLSAFLNGGLTPGGGGFTFGSQLTNDDDANDVQKDSGSGSGDDASKSNGKSGEKQQQQQQQPQLTQAEHAQMFLRLLEAKMAKRSASPYAQLGFQPPSHHQHYAASQAGPSFSDASSASSSSSSTGNAGATKEEDDSSLSPINVYTRLAQHPAFLSTNAIELEELVDSISSSQRQQRQPLFQPPFNKRKATPTKISAPALYPTTPSGLTPNIYGPNGVAARSPAGSQKELEVDENAVTKMLGLLDQKTSRESAVGGLAF